MRGLWLSTALSALVALVLAAAAPADDKVTGQTYVRHDGGSDAGIAHCNDSSSSATPADPAGGDADPNDGGSRRQGNEPFVVVDPTDPNTIIAGWNDYCLTDLGAGWQGFAYSTDGGATWLDSIVPGYPQDTSSEGQASPLHSSHTDAGDPIGAFDSEGNLYVGGISFNRAGPTNGDVYVSTWSTTPPACASASPPCPPVDYVRTVIVGQGTPSRNFQGIFQDKPMLEVDRTGGSNDGNVYVCWSRFTGAGQNKIYFSRSTDGGQSFSRPFEISRSRDVHSVQGCDIAVEADGDVYVSWRTFNDGSPFTAGGLGFTRSTNGGRSFSRPRLIRPITVYNPFDSSRDCGDGSEHCPADFVFHRVPLEPRITADQTGMLPGVYIAYNAVDPLTIVSSDTSYSSAGAGKVGQSRVYVIRTINDGFTWSDPVAVDPQASGHQYFADIDAHEGKLGVVWQDTRTDPVFGLSYPIFGLGGPLQVPFGNTYSGAGQAVAVAGTNVVNTFYAPLASQSPSNEDDFSFGAETQVSSAGHQPQYEMFANRSVPFQGDYNQISLAEDGGSIIAYMAWTDSRDVVAGDDPRETDPNGDGDTSDGFDDDFDVHQCRVFDSGAGAYGADLCPNAGGLDQNIYGAKVTLP